jgi:replicative DNA helicase
MHSLSTLLNDLTCRIEMLRSGNVMPDAVSSGMKELDRVLNGFQKGKLYVIAQSPSVGTTAFMVNLVHNMLLKPAPSKKVAVFLLDQSQPARGFLERLLSCTAEIWLEKIIRGEFEDHEWEKTRQQGINRLLSTPLFLDDEAAISVTSIDRKCEELINGNCLDIVFIDNLQLIKKEKGLNPDEEITTLMRSLRDIAITRKIPIVVLSNWSTVAKNTPGRKRKLQLPDIADTGPIGQEADAVLFLYRPEHYDITSDESGKSMHGVTCIKIAKNLMGSLDTIRMKSRLHIQKFEEYEYDSPFSDKEPAK